MSSESYDPTNVPDLKSAEEKMLTYTESAPNNSESDAPSKFSTSGISTWAKNLKIPQPFTGSQDPSPYGKSGKSTFSRLTSGLRLSPKSPQSEESYVAASPPASIGASTGIFETITKGLVDSSKNAVKAVQVKARHVISQNKRRYQDGGFDLDMTYITENIIAMGFPSGDMSSGFFGYVEDKYKVYNLCSERLYVASLFEGKVASFPFDDHNCPPIQLIISFCQSAYSWLKEDIENVVVVHCKVGMARTGLMISSLLYLKFFPTAEESIDYYNQKRCIDGKGLVLPSQIRHVKYFERILAYFNGENQTGRRCMLREFRLHRCPYWIRPSITISDHNGVLFSTKKHPRTKDLSREDYWFSAPKKGIMVFALPGEPGLTELAGDFKVHFHDRQGDFYCWLNTTMIKNRKDLNTSDLDGFDKRKLPSPGFQVELVLVDYDPAAVPAQPPSATSENSGANSASNPTTGPVEEATAAKDSKKDKDDEFSDSDSEETTASSKSKQTGISPQATGSATAKDAATPQNSADPNQISNLTRKTEEISIGSSAPTHTTEMGKESVGGSGMLSSSVGEVSEFKAMAADASICVYFDRRAAGVQRSSVEQQYSHLRRFHRQWKKVLSEGFDDTAWPLQDKRGRHSGEVRLIMHYSNAKKAGKTHAPSAPSYATAPPVSPYSVPPPATSYPPAGYPPSTYPPSAPHYPSYPPNTSAYPPMQYHQPAAPAYPPAYPPTSSYPPQSAYPPPSDPHYYPPGSYPPPPYPPPSF